MHEQLHNLRHTWLRHEYIKQFTAIMTRIPKTIYCSTSWKDYRDGLRLNFNIEERKAWKVQSLHMDGLSFARLIRLTMGLSRVVMEGTREYLSHLTMINEKHCPKLKGIRRIRVDWSQEKALERFGVYHGCSSLKNLRSLVSAQGWKHWMPRKKNTNSSNEVNGEQLE